MTATASRRGTTNRNDRGSTANRRARREWLLKTYRANESLNAEPMCRCYRCGRLLHAGNITVDRIIPGSKGGTYRRNNIRPACARCNSATGCNARRDRRSA